MFYNLIDHYLLKSPLILGKKVGPMGGQIKPIIDSIFDLEDGNAALERMEKGLQFGKIFLRVD